jgi:hypothetical protein
MKVPVINLKLTGLYRAAMQLCYAALRLEAASIELSQDMRG